MSYILDALKSSDRQRKNGSVPDLQSQSDRLLPPAPAPDRPAQSRRLPWIALLLVAALVAWLVQRTMVMPPAEAPAVEAVVEPEPEPEPPADMAPAVEAEVPPEPEPVVDDDSLDELADVQLAVEPLMEEDALAPPAPADVPAAATVAVSDEPLPEPAPAPAPEPSETAAEQPAAEAGSVAIADPYAGIPHQNQLPSDVQRALPELDITVHIYSATPSSRLVRINRRTLQEGDVVENDLTLEEITPDGLILSINGTRYWRYVN
ncbi:MAG: general secretion pathway protein GspB [Gammaproteobacteria bacterium]|nr:general secretion pathway protein GspB [Gammaproteobacteria bacterium]